MSEQEPEVGPVVKVARDLTEIMRLHDDLLTQAVHKANDGLMPGGEAMVALGSVANLEAWENLTQASEALGKAYTSAEDEDPDEAWSAFQRIEFWSESWRRERGEEYDMRPTIVSEASYVKHLLDWAWENELGWDDFAQDIRDARAKLENILHDGTRSERGVQCFDCQVDLIRPVRDPREPHYCEGHDGVCSIPHKRCPHDRGGLVDEWRCPSCDRRYDAESYRRAVTHAHFVHASWLPLDMCAERTGVKAGTIKVWANRGKVAKRRDLESGRMLYSVEDTIRAGGGEVLAS